eukprot:1560732-Amphidinium_carterae.1
MTCKFFLSDDGCKKGRHCEAKHTPAKGRGCRKCGSLKHSSHECEYGKQLGKDKDKHKKKSAKPKANEAVTSSAAAKSPTPKKPRNKEKDGK